MSQTARGTEPVDTLLIAGVHFMAAARIVPEAAGLDKAFQPAQDRLSQAHELVRRLEQEAEAPRVRVTLADIHADAAVRVYVNAAKNLDGGKFGATCEFVLPGGVSSVVPLQGQSEVDAMGDLLTRHAELARSKDLSSLSGPQAQVQSARDEYVLALGERQTTAEKLAAARMQRDLAVEDWITIHVKMQGRIRDLFPRDKRTFELFFYEFRSRSGAGAVAPQAVSSDGEATGTVA